MTTSLPALAKTIDHSLLHPTLTSTEILSGLRIARDYNVATACVKPYLVPWAVQELGGSDVMVCPVVGFPHGNSTTRIKVLEAEEAAKEGSVFTLDDRIGLVHDAFALANAGFAKVSSALTLVQRLRNEKECRACSSSIEVNQLIVSKSLSGPE